MLSNVLPYFFYLPIYLLLLIVYKIWDSIVDF